MRKCTPLASAVSVLALSGLSALPAQAQVSDAAAADQANPDDAGERARGNDSQIAEIVVTAQFRDQSLQEAPLAITAVDAALLEARSQTRVEDVAQRAPGVQFTAGGQGGGAQTAAVTIRGIGQNDFQFPNEPGVGVYIDDVYYGITFGAAFDLVDLDRVEILRGPQGTLAGKNSIGGAIKLFSQLPDGDPDAYVEGTYGSFNRIQLRAGTNITIAEDKLYARLTGLARHVDGYMKRLDYGCVFGVAAPGGTFSDAGRDCVIGTEGGQEVYALRGALRWIASDSIENNLIADFTEDRSEASPGKLIIQPPTPGGQNYITGPEEYTNYATYTGLTGTPNQFTFPAESFLRNWGVSNTLDVALSDVLSLKSITAYRFARGLSYWDGDASPEPIITQSPSFRHEQFTQELRLFAEIGDLAELTVGAYYYDASSRQFGRVSIAPAALDFLSNDPFDQTSKSAFAHAVLHPLPGFNVTGGVRYTKEDKTYTFSRKSPIPGVPTDFRVAPLDGLSASTTNDHWDWRIALDYEVVPDVRFYGQIATGFKGGGINPRPYYPEQVVPFGIEESTSYEVGIKSLLFDRRLRLNADYFHNDYTGYQSQVLSCPDISPILPPGVPVFCGATRNVGDAKIDGVEVEFDARPVPGLSIDGSISWIDFRFVSGLATSSIVPGVTDPVFVPKWKYALGAQYEVDLDALGTLTPRLDWQWQSEIQSTLPNNLPGRTFGEVESRGLMNARLTYRTADEDWEVALAATNLFDKFYYANKYDQVVQSGNAFGLPGRPREVMVSLKRNF